MKLPKKMGLGTNVVARQVRCVYGTRDAGKLWEDTYTQAMEHAGFTTGAANPCVFYHKTRDITVVVHGDDFSALGTDHDLDWYEASLKESFEIKVRGRLGEGCNGPQELRILNRVVSVNTQGLTYEADPRHTDILMSSLSLTSANASATPGVKPHDRDDLAVKIDESESIGQIDHDAAIAAICSDSENGMHKCNSRSNDLCSDFCEV